MSRVSSPEKAVETKSVPINISSSGDNIIIPSVAGKKFKIYAFSIQSVGTVIVKFKNGASEDLTGPYSWQTREGLSMSVNPPYILFETSVDNVLILNLSAAIQVVGHVSYFEE